MTAGWRSTARMPLPGPALPGMALPARFRGIGRARRSAGALVMVLGLALLVAARQPVRGIGYPVLVLLVLLLVVAGALLGGIWVALPGAVGATLLLNWFFSQPFGTLAIASTDELVVLVVFLVVATAVSWVVDLAARRTAEAARARAEAETLSQLAGATLAEHRTLTDVLDQVRSVFDVQEAALFERAGDGWTLVEASGDHQSGAEVSLPCGEDLLLRVRGRELLPADRRVLASFASAAAGALHGRRVAQRAAEAAQLEAVDRMRATLLAGVGHDLRTPLASVKAAVSSLRQGDVAWTPAEQAELLATIEASADQLQSLVANLLDASRLRAGGLSTAVERVRLEELVGRALLGLGRLDLVELAIPEELPDVLADVGLAERVLANALENAFRHGGGAGVTVRGARGPDGGTVVCDVVDHGPGVPPEAWDRIFTPFDRLDGHGPGPLGDRAAVGLGLGLSVARGFAEAMGGRLDARPTPGGGLTIRFLLPIAQVGPPSTEATEPG